VRREPSEFQSILLILYILSNPLGFPSVISVSSVVPSGFQQNGLGIFRRDEQDFAESKKGIPEIGGPLMPPPEGRVTASTLSPKKPAGSQMD
jgi:hypothetical protein